MTGQAEKLEASLAMQAGALADAHLRHGEEARDAILAQAREQLEIRAAREQEQFRLAAERLFRQRVQAASIRFAAEHDRLRWVLVEGALAQLRTRLTQLVADPARYHAVLRRFVTEGATAIVEGELVAEFCPQGLDVREDGARIAQAAAPGRGVEARPLATAASGGVRVLSGDGRVRVDNSFEGRLARLEREITQRVMETLFPGES
jgi:V/A-type H+/Na+-transporting ATPase subunit E